LKISLGDRDNTLTSIIGCSKRFMRSSDMQVDGEERHRQRQEEVQQQQYALEAQEQEMEHLKQVTALLTNFRNGPSRKQQAKYAVTFDRGW